VLPVNLIKIREETEAGRAGRGHLCDVTVHWYSDTGWRPRRRQISSSPGDGFKRNDVTASGMPRRRSKSNQARNYSERRVTVRHFSLFFCLFLQEGNIEKPGKREKEGNHKFTWEIQVAHLRGLTTLRFPDPPPWKEPIDWRSRFTG